MRYLAEFSVDAETEEQAREMVLAGKGVAEEAMEPTIDRSVPFVIREVTRPDGWLVDLKWSLWSRDLAVWEVKKQAGVWEKIEKLPVGKKIMIRTSPRKMTRFGSALIERHEDQWSAEVEFEEHWGDTAEELAETLGLPEGEQHTDALMFVLPFAKGYEAGVQIGRYVEAKTVQELMDGIDAVENDLIDQSNAAYKKVEAWAEEYVKKVKA
jgi:hypothetical protein